MKFCPDCSTEKPASEFYADRSRADGLWNRCKACERARRKQPHIRSAHNAHNRAWDARNPERRKAMVADWMRRNRDKMNEYFARWRRANLTKAAAHAKVHRAIKRGLLTRLPCEVCGQKAHAHHEDYSKPLAVRWLCKLHHKAVHMASARSELAR